MGPCREVGKAHLISQQLETVVCLETIGSLGTVSVAPYTNSTEEQPKSSLGTDLIPKYHLHSVRRTCRSRADFI